MIDEWQGKTPNGTGFVVDTLFSAGYALEGGTSFKGVIRRSILLGNDTDTTAARWTPRHSRPTGPGC